MAAICVAHDQIEAMTLASRVAVVNKGIIEQLGSPQEIHEESENPFVARSIGTPPMNLIRGRIDSGVSTKEAMPIEDLPDEGRRWRGGAGHPARPRFAYRGRAWRSARTCVLLSTMPAELTACPAMDGTIGVRFERSWIHVLDVDSGRRVRMDVAGGRRA